MLCLSYHPHALPLMLCLLCPCSASRAIPMLCLPCPCSASSCTNALPLVPMLCLSYPCSASCAHALPLVPYPCSASHTHAMPSARQTLPCLSYMVNIILCILCSAFCSEFYSLPLMLMLCPYPSAFCSADSALSHSHSACCSYSTSAFCTYSTSASCTHSTSACCSYSTSACCSYSTALLKSIVLRFLRCSDHSHPCLIFSGSFHFNSHFIFSICLFCSMHCFTSIFLFSPS